MSTIQKRFLQLDEKLTGGGHRIRRYFLLYTGIFVLVCGVVFCWYYMTGRTLIWQTDGWSQHYKALVYYARYLRSIIRELLYHHQLVIPEWDFALGEGGGILQSLHYYVIGDPFTVLSVFVPTRFMWLYYDFTILLRLYLAGAAFSWLCFYARKDAGRCAVMAGALTYVFCYWALLNANRHPYFLNPLLYFPLILLGMEKILRKEKPWLFILAVFLAAVSNFYYFYVIVLLTVAYAAIRLIAGYRRDIPAMLKMLLRIAGAAVLGTMMGAVILLPACTGFLGDARMGSGNAWHLFYPLSYYSRLLGAFFSGDGSYWLMMGYSAPVILAVFLLFLKKGKNGVLKACFLGCVAILLIPALGQLLNGLSYMSNKWCWAFALVCAYALAVMWPDLMNLRLKDAFQLLLCLSLCFLGLLMLEYSRTRTAFACIGVAFLFLMLLFPFRWENPQWEMRWAKAKPRAALLLVIVGIANVSFFLNADGTGHYAREGVSTEKAALQLTLTETAVVQNVAEMEGADGFYRYSGRNLTANSNMVSGLSSTQYYWTISNSAAAEFMRELELLETLPQMRTGYDDRTALVTLSSVLYYVVPHGNGLPLPCGFTYVGEFDAGKNITDEALAHLRAELGTDELTEEQIKVVEDAAASRYILYRNDNALPLGYTYDTVISRVAWNSFSAVEKQEAMLQAVMLEGYDGAVQDESLTLTGQSMDYEIRCNGTGVTLEEEGFVVTAGDASVTFLLEGLPESELYFSIHGLDYDGASTYDLYFGDDRYDPLNLYTETRWNLLSASEREAAEKSRIFRSESTGAELRVKSSSGVSKKINYYTEDYSWYNDRHDFTVNLDYTKDAVTSVTVTFSSVGIYSFDSIEVICQPMDRYEEQVAALKRHTLENVRMEADTVAGTISLDDPAVLCLTVPFSDGWSAYVDGQPAELYRANVRYMALALDAGEHEVELVYRTPYLRTGAAISAAAAAVFAALFFWDRYGKRRIQKKGQKKGQNKGGV